MLAEELFDRASGIISLNKSWFPLFSFCLLPCRSSMEVLSGPWADLALLLRQIFTQIDRETDSFLPVLLFGMLLFLSVCVLLLQLIIYLSWKLRQGRHVINFSCLVHAQTSCYVTIYCGAVWLNGSCRKTSVSRATCTINTYGTLITTHSNYFCICTPQGRFYCVSP